MIRVWRVVFAEFADNPLSTLGAFMFDGRWHSAGQHVLYTASTESLARLEKLVHLTQESGLDFVLLEFALPEKAIIDRYEELLLQAPDWRDADSVKARDVGDWWLSHSIALGLSVPSVLSHNERDIILAKRSPLFTEIKVISATPFRYDPRLYPRPAENAEDDDRK